ncbi:uncharacterized protein LOC108806944 isoform X2 [Raphanus sativus]|uniref:Uncharacterized protein LOC108806944 isoform X2 n=1 Tax=Raphanus sativus TaxID=3726 RepID=A0A6J0JGB4_RAPSA|nr:uncharacterized protein LOC108806944 isoform X2 [Raphanus sativus]
MGVNMVLVEEKYIVSLVDHSLRLIIPLFGHLNTLLREGAVYELSDFDERNTAADFILCYEEMQPFVQTLPLVILQKEIVLSKLVSGLHMKARFSLKTLLGLIAVLSRDLLDSFIPLLQFMCLKQH